METNCGTLVPFLSCLCIASMVAVCLVSGHYGQSIKLSVARPGDSATSTTGLQTKVSTSHEFQAVFSSQPPAVYVSRLRNRTLVVSANDLKTAFDFFKPAYQKS